jgi:hypothetical protein
MSKINPLDSAKLATVMPDGYTDEDRLAHLVFQIKGQSSDAGVELLKTLLCAALLAPAEEE